MRHSILLALVFFVTLLVLAQAQAGMRSEQNPDVDIEYEQYYMIDKYKEEMTPERIAEFVKTPENGTDWTIFAQTDSTPYIYKDEMGEEWDGLRPVFKPDLQALDGTEILIQGFMFPLTADERQSRFLFGPFPASCPFHYHVTNNLIVEVHMARPLAFTYDAVNLRGRLELVPQDDQFNVFYRLKDARQER